MGVFSRPRRNSWNECFKVNCTCWVWLGLLENSSNAFRHIAGPEFSVKIFALVCSLIFSTSASHSADIDITESKGNTPNKTDTIAGTIEDKEDKTDVPMVLRTTVHGDLADEPDRVEEGDAALTEALRKYQQVKEVHPPYIKDKDEDHPEPVPSLASPKKKWAETTTRAEEVPPGFVTKDTIETARRLQQSNSSSMEPNPVLMEEAVAAAPSKSTPKTGRTGKVDVAREFDEIAAKFNEEMDKAEKKK